MCKRTQTALTTIVRVSKNYGDNGLVTTNIHKQYESPISCAFKPMAWIMFIFVCFFFTKVSHNVNNKCTKQKGILMRNVYVKNESPC